MSHKLAVLKGKERLEPEQVSLDTLILAGFASTLAAMDSLGFNRKKVVELQEGLSVEIDIPLGASVEWPYYLTELACMVDALSVDNAPGACRKLMREAGWVFGRTTIKTPAWMRPHVELTYEQLVSHGFEWAVPSVSDRG